MVSLACNNRSRARWLMAAVLGLSVVAVMGCDYDVQLKSNPSGATVYYAGKYLCTTPCNVEVSPDNEDALIGEYLYLRPITVEWASGATTTEKCTIDLKKYPKGIQITIDRPDSIPGLAIDVQHADNVLLDQKLNAVIEEQHRTTRVIKYGY